MPPRRTPAPATVVLDLPCDRCGHWFLTVLLSLVCPACQYAVRPFDVILGFARLTPLVKSLAAVQ